MVKQRAVASNRRYRQLCANVAVIPTRRAGLGSDQRRLCELVGCKITADFRKAGFHVRCKHKHKHTRMHTCEPGRRKHKRKKKERALVLASSRFTRGLCFCLCLRLRRRCKTSPQAFVKATDEPLTLARYCHKDANLSAGLGTDCAQVYDRV